MRVGEEPMNGCVAIRRIKKKPPTGEIIDLQAVFVYFEF